MVKSDSEPLGGEAAGLPQRAKGDRQEGESYPRESLRLEGPSPSLCPGRKAGPPPAFSAHCSEAATCFLCRKVFHKLRLCISEVDIQKVVANTPGAIEPILCALREKVEDRTAQEDPPGADDPGASSAHADGPWVGLTTHTHAVRTQLEGPGNTQTPGCSSCWRRRSRLWLSCRSQSRHVCFPEDFADEGGQVGAAGKAEGPVDWSAVETHGQAPVTERPQRRLLPEGSWGIRRNAPSPSRLDPELEPTWDSPDQGSSRCGRPQSSRLRAGMSVYKALWSPQHVDICKSGAQGPSGCTSQVPGVSPKVLASGAWFGHEDLALVPLSPEMSCHQHEQGNTSVNTESVVCECSVPPGVRGPQAGCQHRASATLKSCGGFCRNSSLGGCVPLVCPLSVLKGAHEDGEAVCVLATIPGWFWEPRSCPP
uniref:Uncharacterized protein n=1 Tax=Equus asinus TaxID=9793 RepID=A0A9L0J7N8_EQUAS